MLSWFAVIPPGLEAALVRELAGWLRAPASPVPGGVRFPATLEEGARLSSTLRTPTRLLVELAQGPVTTLDALAALVRRVDWRPFLTPNTPLEVSVTASNSRVRFRGAAEKKVELAIADALRGPRLPGYRPREAPLVQRVSVRIDADVATVSLDVGGELLHFRGWRQSAGKAPLRENLAAALLVAAGWTGDEALVDPFCGSGTFPIEAALMAAGRPPWTRRRFSWEGWPAMAGKTPPDPRRPLPGISPQSPLIVGADKDGEALADATENARRAGVGVRWTQCDVCALEAPAPTGLVIANPPYGLRLGRRVDGVYRTFGQTLRDRFVGWRVAFLAPDRRLAGLVDPAAEQRTTFSNGGVRVGLYSLEF